MIERNIVINESIKCFRAPNSLLLLFFLLFPALLVFLFIYPMPYEEFLQRVQSTNNDLNPFHFVFKWFRWLFNIILIPYYSVFLIWYFEIERRTKSWKYISALPVKFNSILYAKILISVCFIGSSILFSGLSLQVITFFLKNLKPDWSFSEYQNFELQAQVIGLFSVFICSLPAFLVLFISILIYNNPGLVIIISSIVAIIPSQINPFHLHVFAMASIVEGNNKSYLIFGSIAFCILSLLLVNRYAADILQTKGAQ